MAIERTRDEIDEQIHRANNLSDSGENPFWGMTYADGVREALMWLTDAGAEEPIPEDPTAQGE